MLHFTGGTIGSVEDFGITDANNMGAAMAPAAFKTIKAHLSDYSRRVEDYDRIITGDLGIFGSDMLYELLRGEGIEIADRHEDCGKLMFSPEQKCQLRCERLRLCGDRNEQLVPAEN